MKRLPWLVFCLTACGGGSSGGAIDALTERDSQGTVDADRSPDAGPGPDAIVTGGALVVTRSPAGSNDVASWEGLLVYRIDEDGAAADPLPDVAASLVRDPAGLAYRAASSELLVGNRHGNTSADGTAGSISRFTYAPTTQVFTPGTPITGNGLSGVHQVFLSPTTGELFAANVSSGISRFTFAGDEATANGTISDGLARGVAVSPDGGRLYVSGASNVIRQFDLASGTELASVTLEGAQNLHFFAVRRQELYAAALDADLVHRFPIDVDGTLGTPTTIAAPSPLAIAFSEDEREMFVTGHRDDFVITRFLHRADDDSWQPGGEILSAASLGGAAMLPIR